MKKTIYGMRKTTDDIARELADAPIIGTQKGSRTKELLFQTFVADKPYLLRKPKEPYQTNELDWFIEQSLDVSELGKIAGFVPKIWKEISDSSGKINSNYGWVALSPDNLDQWKNAMDHLILDKNSRRAILIYDRPSMHIDWAKDRPHEEGWTTFDNGIDKGERLEEHRDEYAKIRGDFMCCQNNHFFIRDDTLYMGVQMRSFDVVFGYNADYKWFNYLFDKSVEFLKKWYPNLTRGDMVITADSIHVYERHWGLLDKYLDDSAAEEEFKAYAKEAYSENSPVNNKAKKSASTSVDKGLSDNPSSEPRYSHNDIQHWDIVQHHRWGYLLGNSTKYVYRCRYKGTFNEDLIKAERYIQKFVSDAKAGKEGFQSVSFPMGHDECSDLNDYEFAIVSSINNLSCGIFKDLDDYGNTLIDLIEQYRHIGPIKR